MSLLFRYACKIYVQLHWDHAVPSCSEEIRSWQVYWTMLSIINVYLMRIWSRPKSNANYMNIVLNGQLISSNSLSLSNTFHVSCYSMSDSTTTDRSCGKAANPLRHNTTRLRDSFASWRREMLVNLYFQPLNRGYPRLFREYILYILCFSYPPPFNTRICSIW